MIAASCHPDRQHHARGMCVTCYRREVEARRYRTDPEHRNRVKARARAYHENHKDEPEYQSRRRDYQALYQGDGRHYAATMRYRYGLSPEDRDALAASQDYRCAICGNEAKLVIDHNHKTNQVRALLCDPCNWLIGYAREDVAVLRAAISYLETHG